MTFLHDCFHLSRGANHCMVIYGIRIHVILNEKPCHDIRTSLDLFNYGICIPDGKSMDFLPGMLFVFITDVQKRFVTAQHGGDGLKVSLLV